MSCTRQLVGTIEVRKLSLIEQIDLLSRDSIVADIVRLRRDAFKLRQPVKRPQHMPYSCPAKCSKGVMPRRLLSKSWTPNSKTFPRSLTAAVRVSVVRAAIAVIPVNESIVQWNTSDASDSKLTTTRIMSQQQVAIFEVDLGRVVVSTLRKPKVRFQLMLKLSNCMA